jgi:hypothetical protein
MNQFILNLSPIPADIPLLESLAAFTFIERFALVVQHRKLKHLEGLEYIEESHFQEIII